MSDLVWTREPPTVPGVYYMRGGGFKDLPKVRVMRHGSRGLAWLPDWAFDLTVEMSGYGSSPVVVSWAVLVSMTDAEWAGPIPGPNEKS